MVNIANRMTRLSRLLRVRVGPGAAILPKDVQRITMRFAPKIDGGHRGPKKFFKEMLPRLKFRNPAVQMLVDRSEEQTGPAIMTVHFATPTTDSPSPAKDTIPTGTTSQTKQTSDHQATERVVSINMKGMQESDILRELVQVTKAKELQPEEWETKQLEELAVKARMAAQDSARQAERNAQKKREEEMLAAARGDMLMNPA